MIEDFVMDMGSNDIELKQIGETQAAANNGAYGYAALALGAAAVIANNGAYGYAALALGAAAVIAYSIRRRGVNKTSGISEPLIDD